MLNLLPPNEKKFLFQERKKRLFIVLSIELSVFLICVLLVLLAIEFYILGEANSQNFLLQQAQVQNQSSDFSNFKDIILNYNKKLILIDSFYKNRKFMNGALDILLGVRRPSGLYFTNLSLQSQQQSEKIKVNIAGTSATRDDLLLFKKNIEAERKIENINFSPESWISQKNINFNVTLDIADGN